MPSVTTTDPSVGELGVGSRVPVIATLATNPAMPSAGGQTIVMTCRLGQCCASGTGVEPAAFDFGTGLGYNVVLGLGYGNGHWVAAGFSWDEDFGDLYEAALLVATDPAGEWTPVLNPFNADLDTSDPKNTWNQANCALYADGTWVVGGTRDQVPAICHATDPTGSWSEVTLGDMTSLFGTGVPAVAYGNGTWLAMSIVYDDATPIRNPHLLQATASDPGGTWTIETDPWPVPTTNTFSRFAQAPAQHALAFGNGWFVAIDNARVVTTTSYIWPSLYYTTDPTAGWTQVRPYSGSGWSWTAVLFREGTFYAFNSLAHVWSATDPAGPWTQIGTLSESPIDAIPGEGCFLATIQSSGVSAAATSTDGETWASLEVPSVDSGDYVNSGGPPIPGYGNGQYVIVEGVTSGTTYATLPRAFVYVCG